MIFFFHQKISVIIWDYYLRLDVVKTENLCGFKDKKYKPRSILTPI
jgi:hypothetical protein